MNHSMKNGNERYLARLRFWLRAGGVNSMRLVSVLTDVRTHLTDSGENPYEAFGPPRSYAKEFHSGSNWSWARRSSGVLALASLVIGCYSVAGAIAHLRTQRPLWWSAPQWVVVTVTIIFLLGGWQALLYFASQELTSLPGEDVNVEKAWKRRVLLRRIVSIGLLFAVVAVSGVWGTALGHSYLNSPKLRAANYVYSASGPVSGSSDTGVSVRTVIYLDAPGPATSLNMAMLSTGNDPSGSVSSSLQGFNSLAQALRVAKINNWSLDQDQVPGFTLNFGSYYVLTWSGPIYSTYSSKPSAQEHLVITYLVSGVGLKTLSVPLTVNS